MTITRPPVSGDRSLHSGSDGQSHAAAHTEVADILEGVTSVAKFGIGVVPTNDLHISHTASTQGVTARAEYIAFTFDNGSGLASGGSYRPFFLEGFHAATDIGATDLFSLGVASAMTFGNGGVAGMGTAHAGTFDMVVAGSGSNSNEYTALAGKVVANGDPFPQSTPGRFWLADFRQHGPIGVQPNLLLGWVNFGNNYYNGSPLGGSSALIQALTRPGQGIGSPQNTKDTYPMDVGILVAGSAGTPGGTLDSRPGFTTGIRVGGSAGAWGVTTSRIGTGISIQDYVTAGLTVASPFTATAAPAIVVSAAGSTTYGIDLKTGTYAQASIRLPNNSSVKARNAADSADIDMLFTNTSNIVIFAGGGLRGTATTLGFYGSAAAAKPTVTGAKGSNAALGSLMTALSTLGLVTDSTSA